MSGEPTTGPECPTTWTRTTENGEAIQEGRAFLESERPREALARLREAYADDPGDARLRSYYGLALGVADRRYQQAIDLCQSAVKQEFFNPDLYLNVGLLNLAFGFKAEGLRYLRRGRMIDPANPEIASALRDLGQRRDPVLPFLPRRHLLNRWLGSARNLLRTVEPGSRVAA